MKMADEGAVVWGYAGGVDTEQWHGEYASRQEAIDAARADYGEDATFAVSMGRKPSPVEYLPEVDWILDDIRQRADEAAGDVTEGFAEVSEEAEEELKHLLKGGPRST
jgi:hypothetical protein